MSKSKQLQDFLLKHIEDFEHNGGGGSDPNLPDFELYAIDFLEFAEKRLNNIEKYKDDTDELINCVAHLKRAVDCQLDTFFHACNLHKTISERNLKFETKLEFLKGIGVFSSRSLARLNTLRNKMEHHYEVPKISDIELYYDLVSAFISVLQGLIFVLTYNREIDYYISINENEFGNYSSTYDSLKPEIRVEWQLGEKEKKIELIVTIDELEDFTYFFRIHLLIIQLQTFATWKHIYNRIKLVDSGSKKGSH